MSLWAELKRRNVFRVAAAYVVIGWLMLQVADIVLGFTGAPDWVGKALIALLVLGFIPVLALAWVFEVGPEGVRVDNGTSQRDAGPQARRLDVITLGAVVLVVLLMIAQHLGPALLNPQPPPAEETVSDRQPGPPPEPAAQVPVKPAPEADPWIPAPGSIAALPFANRSAHAENKFFVDGIHDELLTELARNRALTVISRTSVMEYADTVKNLREIGTELGVANILEGAVQRSGDQVRITVQLIDAATDAHIWAETYDRELTPENLFAVQTDIASEIAVTLGARIAPEQATARREAPTTNAEAYDLFLQARGQAELVDEASIRARIALYSQALALDPEFAAAMGELGREHTNLYWYVTRRDEDRDAGGEWIERGLALQPENPRLRLAKGEYFYRAFLDYEAALAELDRAANGLPGSAEIIALRAFIKRRQGLPFEALDLLLEAALLDPRSSDILGSLVETHWLTGNLEQAERWQRSVDGLSVEKMLLWELGYQSALARYRGERPEVLGTSPTEAPIERLGALFGADQFRWYLFFRDYALAERYLASLEGGPVGDQFEWHPVELMRASLARARGQATQALDHAAAALAEIDEELQQHPDDYRIHMAHARALALLGRADPARDAIDLAMTRSVPQRDAMIESELAAQRFFILALIAESDEVAEAVGAYLQREMRYWDYDGLILDPAFDRHLEHPAFRALAAQHSHKAPGA